MAVSLFVLINFATLAASTVTYRERFRSQFHFSPQQNFMNDPNGLVYYDGEYHLFYQHNPFGNTWGHMSWGHAVSEDLLHWQHLPVAIPEENNIMAFSGSAVFDRTNSSGFGTSERPPLVAIYTGSNTVTKIQDQRIRYSVDRGRTWHNYEGNPVINLNLTQFRDPKVFWYEPTTDWRMVVALSAMHRVQFYRSADLKSWTHLSDFGPAGAVGGVWECPELFRLPVLDNSDDVTEKWVLQVDINPGGPVGGSAGQYFIGHFDGEKFVNDGADSEVRWLEYGSDFFASQRWNNMPAEDGRIVLLGWMNNWIYANVIPTSPWRGSFTIPRHVTLRRNEGTLQLYQNPIDEFKSLRIATLAVYRNCSLDEINQNLIRDNIKGRTLELSLKVTCHNAAPDVVIRVLANENYYTSIGYNSSGGGYLYVDRTKSGITNFSAAFPAKHKTPLLVRGTSLDLRIFVDWSSVEVFVNSGQAVMSERVFPHHLTQDRIRVSHTQPSTEKNCVADLDIFELKSIW